MDTEEQLEFILGALHKDGFITIHKEDKKVVLQIDDPKIGDKEYTFTYLANCVEAACVELELRRK
jgi:hypothetical protein